LGHIGDKKARVSGVGQVFAEPSLESNPKCAMGVRAGRISWEEEQLTAGGFGQPLNGWGLVEKGMIQNNHAARRQFGQQHLLKTDIHRLGVSTALKNQGCHQFTLLQG